MILLGFDVETTGTDKTDRPVQACLMVRSEDGDRVLVNELINPGIPIQDGAAEVHGIVDASVQGMPDHVIAAWKYQLLCNTLKETDRVVLVTYNGRSFDVPMIDRCLGSAVFDVEHIDVLQFARRFFPLVKGSVSKGGRTLSELYLHFLGRELEGAHDASKDVQATLDLLDAMRKKAGMTIDALVEDQRVFKPYTIMPIGKYAGYAISDVPVSWAQFMNDKDLDGDLRATVDAILGKR